MIKLGVTDFGLAESTPALWKGRLVRFDSVHVEYGRPVGCVSSDGRCRDPAMVDSAGNPQPYFRVVDPVSHEVLSTSFGVGHVFGSAMVQPAQVDQPLLPRSVGQLGLHAVRCCHRAGLQERQRYVLGLGCSWTVYVLLCAPVCGALSCTML
eukprot:SAG11_NODE_594_length_8302_cov_1.386810_11_plen_152_part_00